MIQLPNMEFGRINGVVGEYAAKKVENAPTVE